MHYCTWDLAYDSATQGLYGVVWNTQQKLQQVVKVVASDGTTSVVCNLPAKFGNKFGGSKLGQIDSNTGTYYIVVDGKDYMSQYLFVVNLQMQTFKQVTSTTMI